jgi:hypothetical protein
MVFAAQSCVNSIRELLTAPTGLARSLDQWTAPGSTRPLNVSDRQIALSNLSADMAERQARVRYPHYSIYCDRIQNSLREKFRRFSGKIRIVIEVRVSSDRPENLQNELHLNTESVLDVLEQHRGCLSEGLTWGGAYEVEFSQVRHGGANYLQSSRVIFELDLSRD